MEAPGPALGTGKGRRPQWPLRVWQQGLGRTLPAQGGSHRAELRNPDSTRTQGASHGTGTWGVGRPELLLQALLLGRELHPTVTTVTHT